jgi:asparagine synthase (glutamine-hydrolysing)
MTPFKRGLAIVVSPPASRSEATFEALIRDCLRRFPGPDGAEPAIWIDAAAGIAIGVPAEAESAAAIALLRALPGDLVFAATGMHGRLAGLRAPGDDRPSGEVLAGAVAARDPRELALANDDPLALAIWNARTRTLTLSRDRIGHVPVYYGRAGRDLVIATHLNAFDGHPDFAGDIDPAGLAAVLRNRVAPLPTTIFRGVTQLPPGELLTVRNAEGTIVTEHTVYWSLSATHRAALADMSRATPDEISRELQRLAANAIDRAFADDTAPLGIFFSAGVDSNLIAAVATTTSHPVLTFTSRFVESRIDEATPASRMAELLGTRHETLTITPDDLLGAIARLPDVYGQPFADQAALPAIIMAGEAAGQTPLVITGDAGNDLFADNKNYDDYFDLLHLPARVPAALHRPIAAGVRLGARVVEPIERLVDRLAPTSRAASIRSSGLHRIAAVLTADAPETQIRVHSSHNVVPNRYLANQADEFTGFYSDPAVWLNAGDNYDRWRYIELRNVGIGIESLKHERAITAGGTGYRSPLLDPAVIAFALRIPDAVRGKDGLNRWASIDVVRRIAGPEASTPIETGFGVPTDMWLRNELRPWAEALLSEANLRASGIYDVDAVRLEWRQHLSGRHDRRYVLWPILMTLTWLDARKQRGS